MWPQMGTGRGLSDESLGMCRAWQVSSSISGLKGFFFRILILWSFFFGPWRAAVQGELKQQGYDSIQFDPGDGQEVVIFDPNQVSQMENMWGS